MSDNNKNCIFYSGLRKESFCGYCQKDKASYCNMMWASNLTVQAYQDMIDRGWRRSGNYCHKSSMDKTCCLLYPIRCDALDFQLSKSQKKIIKKVTTFLKNGECDQNNVKTFDQVENKPLSKYDSHDVFDHNSKTDQLYVEKEQSSFLNSLQNIDSIITHKEDNNRVSANLNSNCETNKYKKTVKPGAGADPNLPKCRKKKMLRIEKKLAKNPDYLIKASVPEQKHLEDFIEENDSILTNGVQKLRVSLVKADTEEFTRTFIAEASLFAKYQIAVHDDQPDDCGMEQYFSFLVESPLQAEEVNHPDHPGYGSFHQQYWLGDKLIAVGVIDILPKCVSSDYFFYDPDYYRMGLGIYSLLREICLVRQLNQISPDLKYYYTGFYIHTCPKMHYKAKLHPSYLLCPFQYTWHAFDKCIQKLNDGNNLSVFNESKNIDGDIDTLKIENIPVLFGGTLMTYSAYKRISNQENEDEQVAEYITLVGPKLAKQLIYCF